MELFSTRLHLAYRFDRPPRCYRFVAAGFVRYVHTFVDFTVLIIRSNSLRHFILCLIHAITGIESDRVGTEQACILVLACVDGAVN
jgi:hypothetical protein